MGDRRRGFVLTSRALGRLVLLAAAAALLLLAGQASSRPMGAGWLGPAAGRRQWLREPMPWEDGYFDPTYHAWPASKSRQQEAADKQSVKLKQTDGQ
jgi:hypothetical protein